MELRPIRTQADYQEALREIELLFDAVANTPECDRLDVLSTLVEGCEKAHFPIEKPDPIDVKLQIEKDKLQASSSININKETENEKVLCPHCQRTATNGIKCKGICVADNDY
ncbi:hypothetical protein [Nostoc sp. GT001]|uniref:helix-turn-helix domain-containing protein n=1 Tax=Nostoc sp. GT001 TaxID=3056647 RepID=UPI0025AA861E|nr:hypothetical protein [Nostoc sp. GT001]MDM9586007.1 hypothetical protein [Nostoc sp. GT001]